MIQWSVNHLAAQAVALEGSAAHLPGDPDCAHCRRALEDLAMLGLITTDRVIVPDDNHTYDITPLGDMSKGKLATLGEPPPDRSKVPLGLASYDPTAYAPPKPAKAKAAPRKRAPRPVRKKYPSCGTLGGRGMHERRGEKLCTLCKAAAATYQRNLRAAKRGLPPPLPGPPRDVCGSLAGRSRHLRRHEKLCRACADALNVYQRARAARKKQEAALARITPPAEPVTPDELEQSA